MIVVVQVSINGTVNEVVNCSGSFGKFIPSSFQRFLDEPQIDFHYNWTLMMIDSKIQIASTLIPENSDRCEGRKLCKFVSKDVKPKNSTKQPIEKISMAFRKARKEKVGKVTNWPV